MNFVTRAINRFRAVASSKEVTPVVGAERAEMHIRSRFNPIRDARPDVLVRYMEAFEAGDLREFSIYLAAIRKRNDKIKTIMRKRLAAAARNGFEVLTVELPENDAAGRALAEKQKAALTLFYNNVTARDVLNRNLCGGFAMLVRQMGTALLFEFNVHEIVWRKIEGGYTADFWRVPLQFFENTTGALRFIESEGAPYGRDLEPNNWLVTIDDDGGLGQATAVLDMFRRLPLRDWLLFSKKFGVPFLHGETTATYGSEEWKRFVAMLKGFYSDGAVATSQGDKITPVETKGGATNIPMPSLVEWTDRGLSTLWLGSDLSTMSREKDGVGSDAQQGEGDKFEQDDTGWISETLNAQVDKPLIEAMFGDGAPVLAYVRLKTAQRKNIDQEVKVDELANTLGFPQTAQGFSERYNRPLPEGFDGTTLLQGTAGAPAQEEVDPEKKAANEARPGSVIDRFSAELGVPRAWLQPVADIFSQIESEAARGDLSHSELLDFAEQAANRIPELLTADLVMQLAQPLEARMSAAVLQGAAEGLRKKKLLTAV